MTTVYEVVVWKVAPLVVAKGWLMAAWKVGASVDKKVGKMVDTMVLHLVALTVVQLGSWMVALSDIIVVVSKAVRLVL